MKTPAWRPISLLALGMIIFASVPLYGGDYFVSLMLTLLMWISLTQSWVVLSAMTGYISLGHAVFFGVGAYFIGKGEWLECGVLFFALSGSLMVSYVRARAEGLGEDCKVGFMQRPERLVALAVGGLYGHEGLVFVLVLLAVTTNYTVFERLTYIRNKLNSEAHAPSVQ